jgi:hypothetical protein
MTQSSGFQAGFQLPQSFAPVWASERGGSVEYTSRFNVRGEPAILRLIAPNLTTDNLANA